MPHSTHKLGRLFAVALAAVCTLLATSAVAGASRAAVSLDDEVAAGKLDRQVLETLRSSGSVDALVTFTYRSIVTEALSAPRAGGLKAALSHQKAEFAEQEQAALAPADDATVLRPFDNLPVSLVRFESEDALRDVLGSDDVTGIRLSRSGTTSLAESLPMIRQPQVQALGKTGAGTYVAVLDTGVDYTRNAFGCTSVGQPAGCKVSASYELNDRDGYLDEGSFHGTNVAGVVAGVAPGARIIAMDVYGWKDGSLQWTEPAIDAAVRQAINMKANGWNIVAFNLSGGTNKTYNDTSCANTGLASVFDLARQWGILPVVSAGNDATKLGAFTRGISYPACVPGVVSVGAVADSAHGVVPNLCDAANGPDQIMYFSQAGSALSMLAPGNCITAAGVTMQGTSQAAPHVAGAAAVVAQAKYGSSLYYLTGMQTIQNALTSSGPWVYDSRVGLSYHRLDLLSAVNAVSPADSTPPSMGAVTQRIDGTLDSNVPVLVSWSASDASGISAFDVYSSADGGASWTKETQIGATATSFRFGLTPGTAFRFAVRAKDGAGNWSDYRYSEILTPGIDDDAGFTLASPWSRYSWSSAYGGTSYTTSVAAGSSVTYTFTGFDAALIAPTFSSAGRITVMCDGTSYGYVDLYSATLNARQAVAYCHFAQKAQHKMTIQAEGTVGRPRVDLDAFVSLT